MKQYRQLSDGELRTLLKEDKWIHAISTAGYYCDRNGNPLGLKTVTYPVAYEVTGTQKMKAAERAGERRAEILAGIRPGELAFVSMGGDCPKSSPDAVGNHRIRCDFRNSEGRKFFIEFVKGAQEGCFWVDGAMDYALDEEYTRACDEVREWNAAHPRVADHRKYPDQMQYNPFGTAHARIEGEFTFSAVLEFVNTRFGCSYTSARKIDYFVTTDDFTNTCAAI